MGVVKYFPSQNSYYLPKLTPFPSQEHVPRRFSLLLAPLFQLTMAPRPLSLCNHLRLHPHEPRFHGSPHTPSVHRLLSPPHPLLPSPQHRLLYLTRPFNRHFQTCLRRALLCVLDARCFQR